MGSDYGPVFRSSGSPTENKDLNNNNESLRQGKIFNSVLFVKRKYLTKQLKCTDQRNEENNKDYNKWLSQRKETNKQTK